MVLLKEKTASFEDTRSVRDDNGNNSKQEKKSRKRPREDDTMNRKTTQKNQKTYNSGKKTEKDQKDRSQLKCFNCGEYGHAAFKCPKEDLAKKQVADLLWIDDLLGHADTYHNWFRILEKTLQLAVERNITFNLKKCKLFTRKAKFCGRIFTPDGVSHDPDRIEALLAIPQPQTARDLQQFLMASQWMSRSIPEYNKKVQILQDVFEKYMKDQPSRNKSVARQVRLLRFGWNRSRFRRIEDRDRPQC
jgi:hypothetical protein